MNARRVVVPATLALALLVPASAQAKLPAPAVKTVVFGKSVAGVKLGMPLAAAKAAWGPGSSCSGTTCTWSATARVSLTSAALSFTVAKGKVVTIVVRNGKGGGTAIKAFRTTKKIGIGATLAALRKAYPALGLANGSVGFASVDLGAGKTVTTFQFVNDALDVFQIGRP